MPSVIAGNNAMGYLQKNGNGDLAAELLQKGYSGFLERMYMPSTRDYLRSEIMESRRRIQNLQRVDYGIVTTLMGIRNDLKSLNKMPTKTASVYQSLKTLGGGGERRRRMRGR